MTRICRCRIWTKSRNLFVILALLPVMNPSLASQIPGSENNGEKAKENGYKSPNDVISLAESIAKLHKSFLDPEVEELRRQYWTRTFDEIRSLAGGFPKTPEQSTGGGSGMLLSQWKLLLDDSERSPRNLTEGIGSGSSVASTGTRRRRKPRRFEGFLTWDGLLQEWAEEIQDYLDKTQEESGGEYPFSTFGRPSLMKEPDRHQREESPGPQPSNEYVPVETKAVADEERVDSDKISLPIPAPAKPGEAVLPHTDIADKSKRILIVTTASLPWKTGTAVNPLLRAAYLLKGRSCAGGSVTIMLPWLEREADQERVYGSGSIFATPEEQEDYVRTWLRDSANMPEASKELKIQWYTAWQNKAENSIYSMGDITALIPDDTVDICILEEPEHLNWYRGGPGSWTKKFKHVVGILHTNYPQYALDQPAALIRAPALRLLCSWMCRAHCHRVIKLSGTLDKVAPEKELVENVHGVRHTFIDVGREVSRRLQNGAKDRDPIFGADAQPTVYFLGKLLWTKGLGSLMELLKYAEETADLRVKVDMYGGGPDMRAAEIKAQKLMLDMPFHGPLDHAELAFTHKIFINPSTSEVLCTASAEALAMGKFAILPSHPSNDFLAQFPNCLTYTTKEEFVGNLYFAMTHAPEPLTEEFAHALTWDAATQRLETAGCITVDEADRMAKALESDEASIEIALPPIVEDENDRFLLAETLRQTRDRYRVFREKLSKEVRQSTALPKPLRDRVANELNKRLDLDINELLGSPKLRLKLSPAELDQSLLELYETLSESPGGDLLRLIGGGGAIGLQNFYMRRQAQKKLLRQGRPPEFFPSLFDDAESEEKSTTPSQRIRWALRQNVPTRNPQDSTPANKEQSAIGSNLKMSILQTPKTFSRPIQWPGLKVRASAKRSFQRARSFMLLI